MVGDLGGMGVAAAAAVAARVAAAAHRMQLPSRHSGQPLLTRVGEGHDDLMEQKGGGKGARREGVERGGWYRRGAAVTGGHHAKLALHTS